MVDIEETNIGAHALLITNDGKVVLQQRDTRPGIINSGLISMFGGTIKSTDSLKEGLKRELKEELELDINNYEVEQLGTFYKTKKLDGVDWEVNVFTVKTVGIENLKLHEGKEFVCDYPKELLKKDKLTRITRLVLEKYISRQ